MSASLWERVGQVWLLAGAQAVAVEAFVLHVLPGRCPDPSPLHRHLLTRNLRLRGVHYGLDDVGDVFLTGSVPLEASSATLMSRSQLEPGKTITAAFSVMPPVRWRNSQSQYWPGAARTWR